MKAITICQPYAELIVRGQKPIENRTWPTSYRGPLVVHAGKSREWLDEGDTETFPAMPFGAAVGVAQLVACLHINQAWPARWRHLQAHEHANGPWCWILADVRRLPVPIPYRGAQGLWEAPNSIIDLSAIRLASRAVGVDGGQIELSEAAEPSNLSASTHVGALAGDGGPVT